MHVYSLLNLWVNATRHFGDIALDIVFIPEVPIGALHPEGDIIFGTHIVLGAVVVAAEEFLTGGAVGEHINRFSYRFRGGDWGRCTGAVRLIVVSFASALRLGRTLTLVVQVVPVDSRGTLVLVWHSVSADVVLFTVAGVRDKVQGVVSVAADGSVSRCGL